MSAHDHMYGTAIRSKPDWKVLAKLLPYLWQFRLRISVALALLVTAKLANVGVPLTLKHIIDSLDHSGLSSSSVVVAVPIALVVAYSALRFSSVLFGELRDAVFGRVAERSLSLLGVKLFRHLHSLDLEYHLSRKTGGLSRDIERGTNGVSFLLRSMVFSVVPILVEVVLVVAVFLYNYDAIFVWITLGSIVLYIAFSVMATEWRTRFVREANAKDSQANTKAIDSLLNFETVKYFTNERYEEERYQDSLHQREQAKVKNHLSLAALNSGQSVIIAVAICIMMLRAAHQVAEGTMTLGDLAMINALMIQVFIPLNFLGFMYRELTRSLVDVEAMFEVLEVQPKIKDAEQAAPLRDEADGIQFNNVSFAYHSERPILKRVSFSVKPGKKVAIVGASGAGKSTIARLLFRFYDVNDGEILVGGQDIRLVTQTSLRRAIGVVPQDTVLFNDTLLENILYGRPEAAAEEVDRACENAMLSHFIQQLPNGLQTKVGERGLKISGGEKQRVAIARALLKRPRIFLFDEATSSLDSETEAAINRSLKSLAEGHTALIIAHRLSTVVDCDDIIVLDHGQVVEQGDHQRLMEQKGKYYAMWSMQQSNIKGD